MQGKATLILKDKNGRIVQQVEEHNMVTDALKNIFSLTPYLAYSSDIRYLFNNYLPMYKYLLKGVVLFGETVPENASDFMLGGKYQVIATAGDAYSGSDCMRGSFNESQSCEIENGYRFVWDFAPEKAVGTIKSISLTSSYLGNRGDLSLAGASSYYMINPTDFSNSSNTGVYVAKGTGTFFLQKGDNTFYSYSASSGYVKILKYKLSDPRSLKICDNLGVTLERETQINLSTVMPHLSTTFYSYDPTVERLYIVQAAGISTGGSTYYKVCYAVVNPETGVLDYETDWITTDVPYIASCNNFVFNGKLWIYGSDGLIHTCSLSGVTEKAVDYGLSAFNGFVAIDGKLGIDCKFDSSGRRCIFLPDEPKTLITQSSDSYAPIATDLVNLPYSFVANSSTVYLRIRTDYLATINNLTSPIEKTDQHALQIRYEITN